MQQKFDVFTWNEVQTNEEITHGKGQLRLRLSKAAPLFIAAQGVEALAGIATEFNLEISEPVTFRVEADDGVRAFLHVPFPTSVVADGEVFTNIDRLPYESGAVAEVTKARRMLEMEKRQMLAEIRREMAIARNIANPKPKPATPPEDEAEAEAGAETEADAEADAEAGQADAGTGKGAKK